MPCSIGTRKFEHVMLDLGSAINIMYVLVYVEFQSHMLHPPDKLVQLADQSLVMLVG